MNLVTPKFAAELELFAQHTDLSLVLGVTKFERISVMNFVELT